HSARRAREHARGGVVTKYKQRVLRQRDVWAKSYERVLKAAQGQLLTPHRRSSDLAGAARGLGEQDVAGSELKGAPLVRREVHFENIRQVQPVAPDVGRTQIL